MYFPKELVTRIWWKIKFSFEAWEPQKDQSMMNFGSVGSKCLKFMFKDFHCDIQFIYRRTRPHYLTSMNFNTAQPQGSLWPKLAEVLECKKLSCFLPKPQDWRKRHGVQNVVPAWGPLMIWVFFFLRNSRRIVAV